jgi:GNAT superfamily N-acetyltransferase
MRIRPMAMPDVPVLQEIERAAGETFRPLGMDVVADDDPFSADELLAHHRTGLAWVVDDGAGTPVAYLVAEEIDGALHVEQVSVHPGAGRQGLGRRLIDHAEEAGRRRGRPALTLTTFAEVPWNGPYYRRLGFRVLTEQELTPGLVAVRRHEAALGLDAWPRVVMRREIRA